MATIKISELPALVGRADSADFFPIVEAGALNTKKISVNTLVQSVDSDHVQARQRPSINALSEDVAPTLSGDLNQQGFLVVSTLQGALDSDQVNTTGAGSPFNLDTYNSFVVGSTSKPHVLDLRRTLSQSDNTWTSPIRVLYTSSAGLPKEITFNGNPVMEFWNPSLPSSPVSNSYYIVNIELVKVGALEPYVLASYKEYPAIEGEQLYTGAFSGALNVDYIGNFINSYTGSITEPYTGEYTRTQSVAYTGLYGHADSAQYTGQYVSAASENYTQLESTVETFTGTDVELFSSNLYTSQYDRASAITYTGTYARTQAGATYSQVLTFLGQYTGTVNEGYTSTNLFGASYAGVVQEGYTGAGEITYVGNYARTQAGIQYASEGATYTGSYTRNQTVVYAQVSSFQAQYTGNVNENYEGTGTPLNFTGIFSTQYAGNYAGQYASTYSRLVTYTGQYTRAVDQSFSATYLGNVSENFVSNYAGNATEVYAGTYTRVSNVQYEGTYVSPVPTQYVGTYQL